MLKFAVPVLHVSSITVAEEFYCRGLEFRVECANRADETRADPCYMALSRDGVWIHVSSFPGDGVSGGVVYLGVENVDQLHPHYPATWERALSIMRMAWEAQRFFPAWVVESGTRTFHTSPSISSVRMIT